MKIRIIPVLVIMLGFTLNPLHAQKSAVYYFADNEFNKGVELYEKEKYGAAREAFENVVEQTREEDRVIRSEAQYYLAMCAVELYNLDAEHLVFTFIAENPASPHVNEACFRLAGYFYYRMNYPKAISWYNRVDRYHLDRDALSEYYFKKGYAYYMRKDYENARVNFYEILEMDSPYTPPATYYYSHIHYVEENYETALLGFRKIDDDPLFNGIAPYYISQILYIQEKYDQVVEYAPALMDSVSEKRLGEMAKIIGESYFMLGEYGEAVPYLETYRENTRYYTVKDRYQMAFAYYMNGDYPKAGTLFEKITYRESEIAQSALYHLADCYLQQGDKNKARIAFSQASQMDYDQKIREDALFNYAKVTFELSYDPFNEAIRAFNQYITQYPASDRVDEVYNYLVTAYLQTRNFSMALESLEKIKYKDEQIEEAYQKVAFYRGLELYNNLRFDEAVDVLERALEYSQYDASIRARTYYWLGEAAYRSGDLTMAQTYFSQFMDEPAAYQQEEYALAHYSMGYIAYDQEAYDRAGEWFATYINLEEDSSAETLADAYNRRGDCWFVSKEYWQAIESYNEAIRMAVVDRDYALFQKGFTYGILNRPRQKLEVMLQIANGPEESPYVDDALFEAGRTYVSLDNNDRALEMYERIITNHSSSSYMSKSLNQLGLIYFNAFEYDRALEYYGRVAKEYPGTPEADNALLSLENIYVRRNNVDGYLAFVKELGRDVTNRQQDSLMYIAAENAYTSGECEEAIRSLDQYLAKHPNGNYLLNAHYYKADCHLKLNQPDRALSSLEYITSRSRNMFSEPALVAASRIHFDRREYNKAVSDYLKLLEVAEEQSNLREAKIGVMRCYFMLDEYSNTIQSAHTVLGIDKLPGEVRREAWFAIAKSHRKLNETGLALEYFRKSAGEVNSVEGAESKYRVSEILYNQGKFKEAEEEIYDFIEKNTPHQYWMGKAFLLLSDIYLEQDDEFQAIHTLKSIIDYYTETGDGIIGEARQRYESLKAEAEGDIPESSENDTVSF